MKNALKSESLFVFYTQKWKKDTFFLKFARCCENLRKVPPFHIKGGTILVFVFDTKWTNFLE